MKKIKNWLCNRFLPMWMKETVLQENKRLQAENEKLLVLLAEKDAYIDGLQAGIKSLRRVVINTGEVKK